MKLVRQIISVTVILITTQSVFAENFPKGPNPNLTPGSICDQPDAYRYPEQIAYCDRHVESDLKAEIIQDYNKKLGYQITVRANYKIDHYIPLCMGGSNHKDNLWPQHKTVYEKTDGVEFAACEKMKVGKLTQRAAIELLREAKNNLSRAKSIESQINAL